MNAIQNIFVSFSSLDMFLLVGEDPNRRPGKFLKLSGVSETIERFCFEMLNASLDVVFSREYHNLHPSETSLLEFYPEQWSDHHLIRLHIDGFEKTIHPKAS